MKALLPVLEDAIFPILAKCISSDGQDVLEDVLELLAYFTYFGGTVTRDAFYFYCVCNTLAADAHV